jgi:hypothetical protein
MGGKLVVLLLAASLLAGCDRSATEAQRRESQEAPQARRGAAEGTPRSAAGATRGGAADPGDGGDAKAAGAAASKGDEPDKAPAEAESSGEPKPLVLTAEEREKLGIVTAPAQAITFSDSTAAFGVVLSHETIAQAVADLETAASAAHQSQVALTRGQKLAAGPGALGVDTIETLQKQKAADQAALSLARRKITAVVGVRFPWVAAEGDTGTLNALASGEAKLVRATFPSGAFAGAAPKSLRLVPLEPGTVADPNPTAQSAKRAGDAATTNTSLTASPVWDAPQDSSLPGRSFFALLRNADIAEGSRFQVVPTSPVGGVTGVLVPANAVVITSGQYWCYLEKKPGTFARVPIVIDKPLGAGYFVSDGVGVSEGDKVVTSSAGLLLAREMNAATGPDD